MCSNVIIEYVGGAAWKISRAGHFGAAIFCRQFGSRGQADAPQKCSPRALWSSLV